MSRRSAIKAEPRMAAQAPQEVLAVGYLLGRARGSLLTGLDGQLEPFGLNAMQFGVLKHLAEGAAHTAADLCRRMHYDTGSMTRILDRLEHKGLVGRARAAATPDGGGSARARGAPRRFRRGGNRGAQGLPRTDDR